MSLTEKLVIETGVAAVGAGVVVIGATLGAGVGAVCGEILDHVPYLNHAIPEGIGYLSNYIKPENVREAQNTLQGNLDKVGAAMGFVGGFYRSSTIVKKND